MTSSDVQLAIGFLALAGGVMAQPQAGQIVVDVDHPAWFRYAGGGPFYMCGPGDPEGFLYRGVRNPDGTRSGDQAALIGKLAGTGANCIYLIAVRSHGGDGDATQNPFLNGDPVQGLNSHALDQWEEWFTAMDETGIAAFFLLYDDSAAPFGRDLPASGQLKPEEAAFIDAIVARFKHHRHLIWCVAEEYAEGVSFAHAVKIAERIRERDDRQHPVAIHQNHGTSFDFKGQTGFDQFAVQWNVDTAAELHAGTVAAWNNVEGRVNVNVAEFANAGTGVTLRKKLWAIAMGGGYSMVLGMEIVSTPVSDLEACGRLVRFMEATRFNETSPHDELARGDTDFCMADPGRVYIAYGDSGDALTVSLAAGNYAVRWYDPVDGAWHDGGRRLVATPGTMTFGKPPGVGTEAALYLTLDNTAPGDADGDGDVDQEDFGRFQACYSGPGISLLAVECLFADLNGDELVDRSDFVRFRACLSGANVAAAPDCDDAFD